MSWSGLPTTVRVPSGAMNVVPAPFSIGRRGSSGTKVRVTWITVHPLSNSFTDHRSVKVVSVSMPHSSRMKSSANVSV
jgi:hypothetical protein